MKVVLLPLQLICSSVKPRAASAHGHSFKSKQDWWSLSENTVLWAAAVQVQPDDQLRYPGVKERRGGQEEAHKLNPPSHPSEPWVWCCSGHGFALPLQGCFCCRNCDGYTGKSFDAYTRLMIFEYVLVSKWVRCKVKSLLVFHRVWPS